MKRLLLTLGFLLLAAHGLLAQQLRIDQVFRRYSAQENAREVVMSGKSVKKDYHITLFHSLDLTKASAREVADVESAVEHDTREALEREEKRSREGLLQSGFYALNGKKHLRRYIFYRRGADKVSVIYIEGSATMKEMKSMFKK